MKTLVIHPADMSTNFLNVIYEGKDWTVITTELSRKKLKAQIKAHDRIIMLGHGDDRGMYGFGYYVINSSLVYYLRQKQCVCIWCNANEFVKKYNLNGFYTGMIISEYEEAMLYCIRNFSYTDIEQSNELFADSVAKALDTPLSLNYMTENYKSDTNPIIIFNSKNIYKK